MRISTNLGLPSGTRKVAVIQSKTGPADENGEATWADFWPVTIVLETMSGRMVSMARQVTGTLTHVAHVAYYPGKVPQVGMRIAFEGRFLSIAEPPENFREANRRWVLRCQEIGDGGPTA